MLEELADDGGQNGNGKWFLNEMRTGDQPMTDRHVGGIAGHEQADQIRAEDMNLPSQLGPIHLRHQNIKQHKMKLAGAVPYRPHRIIRTRRRHHLITKRLKHVLRHVQDRLVILHQQNGFLTAFKGFRPVAPLYLRRYPQLAGEINLERGSASRFALGGDEAVILFNNPIHGGQAQAGALTHSLGCVKRLENMGQYISRHSATVVRDRQRDIVTRIGTLMAQAIRIVQRHHVSLNDDPSIAGNGITRIDA